MNFYSVVAEVIISDVLKLEEIKVEGAGQVTSLALNKRKNLIQSGLGRR